MSDGPQSPHEQPGMRCSHDHYPSEAEQGLIRWIRRVVDEVGQAVTPDRILTYREVVSFLIANRPAGAGEVKGALLRRRRVGGWLFRVQYLDEFHNPLSDFRTGRSLGQTIVARDCDEELHELFGTRDLIIFD